MQGLCLTAWRTAIYVKAPALQVGEASPRQGRDQKFLEAISKPHLTLNGCVENLLFCYAKLKPGRLIVPLSTRFRFVLKAIPPMAVWRFIQNAHILPMYAALFHRLSPCPQTRSEVLKRLLVQVLRNPTKQSVDKSLSSGLKY